MRSDNTLLEVVLKVVQAVSPLFDERLRLYLLETGSRVRF